MRKRILKYSIWIVVLLFGVGLYSLNADYLAYTSSLPELELLEAPEDTIPPRYPVAKTTPEEYQDIVKQYLPICVIRRMSRLRLSMI